VQSGLVEQALSVHATAQQIKLVPLLIKQCPFAQSPSALQGCPLAINFLQVESEHWYPFVVSQAAFVWQLDAHRPSLQR
jgi:hypothetical protein